MKHRGYFLICCAFLILACGCESKEFTAERKMWRADKMAQAIYKNPKGTPHFQLAKAQERFQEIIKQYPNSLFAIQSQLSIGHLYLVIGEFQKARDEYRKLMVDCGKRGNLCAEAVFAVGQSYELEGKWDEALGQYKNILNSFPFSNKSLDLPIYVIQHYKRAFDEKGVARSADDAVAYYASLKNKTKTEQAKYILAGLAVRSTMEAGRWQEALDALEKLATGYPKNNPEDALLIKALIYRNKLKDPLKAKAELQRILKDYPSSRLIKQVKDFLSKL